jgi:HD-like signal output (HDOD) protein
VLASGLTGAFKAPEGFDLPKFWKDSFAVAATCKWIAKYSKDDAETTFTCGMIHNIGELLIHIILPSECAEMQKVVDKGARNVDIEKNHLGFDFSEAGAELAMRWKFPDAIVKGIRYQLDPYEAEFFPRLAAIINLSLYINKMNSQNADSEAILESFPSKLATELGINLVKLMEKIEETKELGTAIDELL